MMCPFSTHQENVHITWRNLFLQYRNVLSFLYSSRKMFISHGGIFFLQCGNVLSFLYSSRKMFISHGGIFFLQYGNVLSFLYSSRKMFISHGGIFFTVQECRVLSLLIKKNVHITGRNLFYSIGMSCPFSTHQENFHITWRNLFYSVGMSCPFSTHQEKCSYHREESFLQCRNVLSFLYSSYDIQNDMLQKDKFRVSTLSLDTLLKTFKWATLWNIGIKASPTSTVNSTIPKPKSSC